ncbi:MAG TPA: hypothetical protein VFS00_07660 [Polyangiaceae bacterium]|nr:hypothetical protein [Polyangiaceae bacterium]
MWTRILRLLFDHAARRAGAPGPDDEIVALSFRLLQGLANVQSEPTDAQPEVEAALAALDRSGGALEALSEGLRRGEGLSTEGWLAAAFLAELAHQLESRWGDFYAPAFAVFRDTGDRVARLRATLGAMPFAESLRGLDRAWAGPGPDAFGDAVRCAYLAACAELGARGEGRLYTNAVRSLRFERPFLWTAVTAYCVKILDSYSLIDLGDMTDEHYACMALLDNFDAVPGGAWG